jgi:hypothetical protein
MKIEDNIKALTGTVTVVSLIVIAFYATGLYRNMLQIKKIKQELKAE